MLKSLTVSGIDIGTFQAEISSYSAAGAAGTVDITATPAFDDTTVAISFTDGSGATATGTSATLTAGTNTITITNGSDTRTYTVMITLTE